ncbi:MAG: hypothetical protein IK092_05415, partial [Muribaculaceae bacterium]|nr:hypothetical protein [Muribaculaceae bacterium]
MKKIFTLILALVTLTALQANADLWLIGAISPDGWNPSKGVQFTQVDDNNYTLELDVTKTGKQYYGLTSKLGSNSSDWDGIKAYRFGGKDLEVKLDTETTLVEGTDDSPFTNFATAGTYTFDFNISTKVVKVSLKSENPDQPTAFNGTIYIDKESIGNIWAWDTQGNY